MDSVLEAGRKPLGEPVHLPPHPLGGGQGVGARQLEDGDRDALPAVEAARHVGVLGAELDAGHVGEPHEPAGPARLVGASFRARLRLHDHLGEGRDVGKPAERGDRKLQLDRPGGRLLAELAGGHLHILLAEGPHHVARGQAAAGQRVGIEPDPHRVVPGAQEGYVAHPLDSGERVLHLDQREVAQVEQVIPAVGRDEVHAEEDARRLLLGDHPLPLHLLGQLGERHGDAVLRQHLRLVDIGAEAEGDVDCRLTVVGALGREIEHPLDTVDLLLDRRGDRVGHHLGARPRVGRLDRDRGRHDLGILGDRHPHEGHAADDHDHDRKDRGEDGAVDEELGHGWIDRRRGSPGFSSMILPSPPTSTPMAYYFCRG